jgi:hypothetical protein
MSDLTVAPLIAGAVIAALAAVHLWSDDPDRRRRALDLLRLLLRR